MTYNFDKIIDRKNDPFSFSAKWQHPSYVLKQLGINEELEDAICLETADMDFKVCDEIINDLKKLCDHGIFGYSSIPNSYRLAVCQWYQKHQDWDFDVNDIYYFPGTHNAISNCINQYSKPNEGVIVLTPCYGYHSDVEGNNRQYVTVEMINDGNDYFTIDYLALEKACKDNNNTLLILCHPQNPTGRVFNEEELKKIYQICKDNNVLIISDEVHSDILRKGIKFTPIMKACGKENIIACTAVNKTFNLAGLAMTNVIICDPKLKNQTANFYDMPSPFGIQAVISAYTKGDMWVEDLNRYIDETVDLAIDFIHQNLPKAVVCKPEGGYSINIDFSKYNLSDDEVIDKIYRKAKIVMNSGLFFDDARGKQVHRACLVSPKSVILEALQRIAEQFKDL